MPATETAVRDALAAALKSAALPQAVEVATCYDGVFDRTDLRTGYRVTVYPGPRRAEQTSRQYRDVQITMRVAVSAALERGGREEQIDQAMELANVIEGWLIDQSPAGAGFVEFDDGTTGRDPVQAEFLEEQNTFVTVLTPTYRVFV